jgi:hypothetical protein
MNAASLHSALFGGATEVEVGRRIGRFRPFNVAMGFLHAVQGAAILVMATSFTLPIVTRPARLTLGDDHALRSADRLGRHCVLVHLSHRSPGYRITHGVPNVRAHAPEWTELLPLGRVLA